MSSIIPITQRDGVPGATRPRPAGVMPTVTVSTARHAFAARYAPAMTTWLGSGGANGSCSNDFDAKRVTTGSLGEVLT